MYEKVIKVFAMRCDEHHSYRGRIEEIENTLEAKQAFVGGTIQCVRLTDEIDLICNDEGKLINLPINRVWLYEGRVLDLLCGNLLACRHDSEGNFTSILESDIPVILEQCKALYFIKGLPPFVIPEDETAEYKESK